ncbi:MAG TPA: class I SAM-dependent methyltransferase [Fimbriimonas sp.]
MNPAVQEFRSRRTSLLCVDDTPVLGAVRIPVADLANRTFELPSRAEVAKVADTGDGAAEAVAWLERHRRQARLSSFELGEERRRLMLWSPNDFLLGVLSELPPTSALDLACGVGREAVAMSCCGWDVHALDILPDALQRARSLESRYSTGSAIRWGAADLEDPCFVPDRRMGLVTMFRYLHRPHFQRMRDWLAPGGSLVMETFTTVHRAAFGRPKSDDHVLEPGELPNLVDEMEIVRYEEGWRAGAHTARLWARVRG